MTRGQGTPSGAERDGYRGASAPPVRAPTWKRRLYVSRPIELRALADDLADARVLALDAEFTQARGGRGQMEMSHRLALLQLARDDEHTTSYVVDALLLHDLMPLRGVLENPDTLKLFHGISADARMLATRDLVARETLDLEAVSRSIFGQRESSLQAMLQRACNIRLDKSLQRADWARRPLNTAMIAYAARDAEMTYALHGWLADNYPWAVALHLQPADEPPPAVAPWIMPYLESMRGRSVELAVMEAGLANDVAAQERDLRAALGVIRHPGQRSRVMRIITDLGVRGLAPDLVPYLSSPASEERAGAVRALGRLRAPGAAELVRPLLEDDVQDVRQAARFALEPSPTAASDPPTPQPKQHDGVWTSGEAHAAHGGSADDWRAALRTRFGLTSPDGDPPDGDPSDGDDPPGGGE